MLYLEDYLEMIEHLPSELRDRFTELRELDLSVQNQVDCLDDRQRSFFATCQRLKTNDREEEFKAIRKEYCKVIDDANEKIQISEDCYGLLDRYLRKLDQELHNFKMELEADNRGITEILEKKSLELDQPVEQSLKENRLQKKVKTQAMGQITTRKPIAESTSVDSPSSESQGSTTQNLTATLHQMFPLQHLGASGSAIAVAASQAIAATQQLTGRRTSSLKASFEAVSNLGFQQGDYNLGSASTSSDYETIPSTTKRKKTSRPSASTTAPGTPLLDVDSIFNSDFLPGTSSPVTSDLFSGTANEADQEPDWCYDSSEPRYCICNQVSYGDMVACDNDDCPYEWFHYPCVGITTPPKGKWYCPTCTPLMTKKKSRKS